jgi:signal transduction histidine kinase
MKNLSTILGKKFSNLINKKILFISFICGITSYLIIREKINFLLPGTGASTDPREIINSLGAAITGPIGGFIIGVLSSFADNPEIRLYIILQHIITATWIGIAYKKLSYERFNMPWQLLIWMLLMLAYYTVAYFPLWFVVYLYYPSIYTIIVGSNLPFTESIFVLYKGWMPEIIFTTIFTMIVLVALPANLRKPLWGKDKDKILPLEEISKKKWERIFTKVFGRNYIGLRLALWFILLSTLPLAFASIIVRNHFSNYVIQENAFHLIEYAKVITENIDTKKEIDANSISEKFFFPDAISNILISQDELVKYSSVNSLPFNTYLTVNDMKKIEYEKSGYIYKKNGDVLICFAKSNNDKIVLLINKNQIPVSIENELITRIYKNLGITVLIIAIISGIIIWFIIAVPINKLTRTAQEISKGNYDVQVDLSRMTDEIKILAVAFNEMIENIKQSEFELNQKHSEVLKAKDEAEKSDSLKTEFLAQMSHEIRTPLHHMLSYSSIIKDNFDSQLNSTDQKCFQIIEDSGARITRTIDMILNMSQLSLGLYRVHFKTFDLIGDVLKVLLDESAISAQKKKLALSIISEKRELLISSDLFCITQIFSNLLNNAIKFTIKGGVEVHVRINDEKIIVDVVDSGIGISEDYLTRLFEPFSQEEQGYNRSFEGNGLGLALVKNYCDMVGAEIKVESKKDNGSKFTVIFSARIGSYLIQDNVNIS